MNPSQTGTPNPILGDSFLSSNFFNPDYWFNNGLSFSQNAYYFLSTLELRALFMSAFFFFSMFFLIIISYCAVRMFEIRKKEHTHLQHEIAEYAHHQAQRDRKKQEGEDGSRNERWTKTLHYLFSQNPGDWKLAVIEADSMLEALLNQLGFKGEGLGEKLKLANQADFRGLNFAWEAHIVRNRIAHEGASFELSQHEAKRVIALYEQIFRGYGYI